MTVEVEIKFAWWGWVYLHTLRLFLITFDAEPNMERLDYWVGKFMRVRVDGGRWLSVR